MQNLNKQCFIKSAIDISLAQDWTASVIGIAGYNYIIKSKSYLIFLYLKEEHKHKFNLKLLAFFIEFTMLYLEIYC